MLESIFNKVVGLCKIFKNTYFERYLQMAASENLSGAAILIFRRYFRSSSQSAFYKIGVVKTSAKFLGKQGTYARVSFQ